MLLFTPSPTRGGPPPDGSKPAFQSRTPTKSAVQRQGPPRVGVRHTRIWHLDLGELRTSSQTRICPSCRVSCVTCRSRSNARMLCVELASYDSGSPGPVASRACMHIHVVAEACSTEATPDLSAGRVAGIVRHLAGCGGVTRPRISQVHKQQHHPQPELPPC